MCKIKEDAKQKLYKSYVTNCLKLIATNVAKFGGGMAMKKTYAETIKNIDDVDVFAKKSKKAKPVTAEQIISNVMAKGGLKLSHRKGG